MYIYTDKCTGMWGSIQVESSFRALKKLCAVEFFISASKRKLDYKKQKHKHMLLNVCMAACVCAGSEKLSNGLDCNACLPLDAATYARKRI